MSYSANREGEKWSKSRAGDAALEGGTQPTSGGAERCLAHGCPMTGIVSDSTKGGGPWTCSPHRRAAPDQWQAITERANRSMWILRAFSRLSADGPTADLAHKVSAYCVRSGMPDLRYQPEHEELRQWAWRFRLGALGWLESGVGNSTPFGLRQQ